MRVLSRFFFITACALISSLHFNANSSEIKNAPLPEFNPLSHYLSDHQYKDFIKHHTDENLSTNYIEGKVITINTDDVEGCQAARAKFNLGGEVCDQDEKTPLVSVLILREVGPKYVEKKLNLDSLSLKDKIALDSLRSFAILGAGAFGVIYALPESISKWDKSKGFSSLAGQWGERVSEGPVMDEDDWVVNYIGHPVSGAIYYTVVRNRGFSPLESFAFSFAMSTFFWEYGIEAFAEIPSIQDLIITPVIGSIMGELFFEWEKKIKNNNGKIFKSKILGKTASILMDPAGAFSKKLNKILKHKVIKRSSFNITNRPPLPPEDPDFQKGYLGLQFKMSF
ncbi:MAG: DUF3943 domain-containing protein [Bacteriovorax sp.]|jgi:hypothetical protein|nr:DUF3943 domain-containing protein [Bacteriovorax sp.]